MKILLLLVASLGLLGGCATQKYVKNQIKPVVERVEILEGRAATAEADIKSNASALEASNKRIDKAIVEIEKTLTLHADRLAKNESELGLLSKTAQDAVQRATTAGRMAKGKMVYEVLLTNDQLRFDLNKATLAPEGVALLDDLAGKLKAENSGMFIEIQGHTDNSGGTVANMKLGEERAEVVRRHLHQVGGIPLHRMSTVSYGESSPMADNKTAEGRKQNRRVVLVIIQ